MIIRDDRAQLGNQNPTVGGTLFKLVRVGCVKVETTDFTKCGPRFQASGTTKNRERYRKGCRSTEAALTPRIVDVVGVWSERQEPVDSFLQ